MLTLRRSSIGVTEEESDEFFSRLSLDTEPCGHRAAMDRFFKGKLIIEKPWTGSVSKDRTKFKVRRTRTGLLKTGVSMLVLSGKIMLYNNERTIEIKMRPAWHATLTLIWVTAFLGIMTWNFFNDLAGWTVSISIVMLQILFLVMDLNRSDERLVDYIESARSNALQQKL